MVVDTAVFADTEQDYKCNLDSGVSASIGAANGAPALEGGASDSATISQCGMVPS